MHNLPLLAELEQESAATEAFLQLVPADKLTWRPHEKSMTLGQLALHVATLPGAICNFASVDSVDVDLADFQVASPESADELIPKLHESAEAAAGFLSELDDEKAMQDWRLHKGGEELFTVPRIALLRSLLFNHWYHHRGQLSVYLRLLDIPLPSTYGPSADVNPFA